MTPELKHLLESWSTQQDYLWFVALLGWSGVAAAALKRKENESPAVPRWCLALAASYVAGALLELALLAQDLRAPYTRFDFLMGAAQAGCAASLIWAALADTRRATLLRAVALALLAGLVVARLWLPFEAGCALAVAQAAALLALTRRSPRPLSTFVTWLLVAQPIVATHGPWACAFGQDRRTTDWSDFALLASGATAAAGALLAAAVWRRRLHDLADQDSLRRDFRRAVFILASWLILGIGLAVWFGRIARRAFEENLLRRVESIALALDPEMIAEALSPALKIASIEHTNYSDGVPVTVATVPRTADPIYTKLRHHLHRIRSGNEDFGLLYLAVWRQQQLLVLNSSSRPSTAITHVVHHELTAADAAWFSRRTGFLEGPTKTIWGAYLTAKAPLFHPRDGRVLGWVVADVAATRWSTTFVQTRLQTMVLVAVGVGLWILAVAYRFRRAAREASERKALAAVAADRMKSAFLAKVSHELRTPIQSVLGYGELLAAVPLAEPHRSWLAALRAHGGVMLRLVNDLIDLGALQSGLFQLVRAPVNLRALIEDCAASVRPAATAKRLDFRVTVAADVPAWVLADSVRVRQILLNLLGNAVKFTPAGLVDLSVGLAANRHLEFVVTDTGPGIPADQRARLFQPFVRLSPTAGEGSGLGLALIHALCGSMQGGIEVMNAVPTGAVFCVRLPLPACDPPPGEIPRVTPPRRNFSGRRILIAEDNTLVRELLTAFLAENGAEVMVASDGAAALALARTRAPDVLLLDLALPELDGIAVAATLRREGHRRLRIIGLSAHASHFDETRARAAGMDVFLAKPVSLARLADTIDDTVPPLVVPAGSGSVFDEITDPRLRARLSLQFATETPPLLAEMRAALANADWVRLRSRAHYLKNSADLLGATALQDACEHLSTSAGRLDPAAAASLLARIERASALLIPLEPERN